MEGRGIVVPSGIHQRDVGKNIVDTCRNYRIPEVYLFSLICYLSPMCLQLDLNFNDPSFNLISTFLQNKETSQYLCLLVVMVLFFWGLQGPYRLQHPEPKEWVGSGVRRIPHFTRSKVRMSNVKIPSCVVGPTPPREVLVTLSVSFRSVLLHWKGWCLETCTLHRFQRV